MNSTTRGRTTTSVEGIPSFDAVSDPTAGLALVYSRLHAHLPSAVPFAVPTVSLGRESDNTLSGNTPPSAPNLAAAVNRIG